MLEIIDNIYVFALSRARFGDIVASRTRTRSVKRDIFSQLSLAEEEKDFLMTAWENNRNRLICVMGERDENPVPVILVNSLCGAETLGLVVELLEYDPSMLRRSILNFGGYAAVSNAICEIIEGDFEFGTYDDSVLQYLDSVGQAKLLSEIAPFCEKDIYEALQAISRFAGVRIEVSEAGDGACEVGIAKRHFAGSEVLGMLTILALSAREHAKDRTLSVRINRFEEGMTLSVSFVTEKTDFTRLGQYLDDLADLVGVIHATDMVGETFRYRILPYVEDVSLLGVKAPDDLIVDLCFLGVDLTE
ncbi:MAG: hypothetical protein IKJ24_05530 [Clostridia bacterium]|nr:hypothetical protein [Clostridia bacterium]